MKQIILKPVITEKSLLYAASSCYTFEVARSANKPTIAKEIEKIYKVKVIDVNTISTKGKTRLYRGRVSGTTKNLKKAIVRLKKGQKISDFDVKDQK